MILLLVIAWIVLVHIGLLMLCRHIVRRRHYPFFVEARQACGKPSSYRHFLLLYGSWFDPATLVAAIQRPGYRADQIRCAFLYAIGLAVALFVLFLAFPFITG